MKREATCIFCLRQHRDESVEHIVARSLGNLHYILPKGCVCERCNNHFGLVEGRVLSSLPFLEERRRLGLLRDRNQDEGRELEEMDLITFLLKMAFESLYLSRRKIWNTSDFEPLHAYLMEGTENQLYQEKPENVKLRFRPIPGLIDRFRLRNNHIYLEYAESGEKVFFRFQFGRLLRTIRIS